ncbi:MAG: PAS domain-containing protein [Pseudomonadota bacterium]
MQHNTSQLLFAYWDQLRAGRLAPTRTEIDPASIATILPQTLLLECRPPANYRFRIAGTKLCEYLGIELRGDNFLDLWQPHDRIDVQDKLQAIAVSGGAVTFNIHSYTTRGESIYSEVLLLPLSQTNGIIHRLLGAWSLSDHTLWNGCAPLVEHTLVAPEETYKSRIRPQAAIPPRFGRPLDHGRVVASHKHRFRVYDGGRM